MKKFFVLAVAVALFAMLSVASAEDLGVQIIGGENADAVSMSLDDMQLGTSYTIDGYAKVTPVECLVVDYFGQFKKDADYGSVNNDCKSDKVFYEEAALKGKWADFYNDAAWQDSGVNAEFMWLKMDVTNLQMKAVPFMEGVAVKVIYADEYEFAGWVRQINYDYNTTCYRYGSDTNGGGTVVLNPENEEAIDMMYTGTYVFGCTLPNAVIEDKSAQLRVEIKLGENDLTYNIRK